MSENEVVWFSILTGAAVKSTAVLALACLAAFVWRRQSATLTSRQGRV